MVKEKLNSLCHNMTYLNMVRGGKRGYSTGCGLYLVRLKMSRFNLYQIIFYRAGWIVIHFAIYITSYVTQSHKTVHIFNTILSSRLPWLINEF